MYKISKKNIVMPNYSAAKILVDKNKCVTETNFIVNDFKRILNLPIINKYKKNKEMNILEDKTKSIMDIIPTLTLLIMSFMFMSSLGIFTSIANIFLCFNAFNKQLKTWQYYYYGTILMLSIPLSMLILIAYANVLMR